MIVFGTEGQGVPIKAWVKDKSDIEVEACLQLERTARLPFVYKHVAAMPDVHLGKGATVGSVIATKGAVIPAAVGVDIGCGMSAVKVDIPVEKVKDLSQRVYDLILEKIPVGNAGNQKISDVVLDKYLWSPRIPARHIQERHGFEKAQSQLGSLGGGNHFIEICEDQDNKCWVMLHSGSRNIGKVVADYHINEAKDLMKRFFICLEDNDLAFFPKASSEFRSYINELEWCQEYAHENRKEMMRRVLYEVLDPLFGAFSYDMIIDCHHNYCAHEHHGGENVLVTRKGAVRARLGDLGIIPGSMGTKSYIVRGLGNPMSFHSCSHGAGRSMSRTQAKKQFSTEDLERETSGVLCRKDDGVLDEIPSSYKDIDEVMENQKDLVEVIATLKQFICVKG